MLVKEGADEFPRDGERASGFDRACKVDGPGQVREDEVICGERMRRALDPEIVSGARGLKEGWSAEFGDDLATRCLARSV